MANLPRKIQTLDASGKAPGRLATQIAMILMGKTKADYAPNADRGEAVEVSNAAKMVITGKKMDQKSYFHHTTHPGGLRELKLKTLWSTDPADVLRRAVSRMLPKNRLRNERMKRLSIKN